MKTAPYRYANCRVERVVDGDTVDLLVDCGFGIFCRKRIRLAGINCPESRTRDLEEKALGKAATKRMEELLEGGAVDLESHEIGKFGRVLGTLWIDLLNINELMIAEGHAVPYHGGQR
jgi:endonuclease YncB( thermonuclease family)